MNGDWKLAPEELVPDAGLVRDGRLATIGGGNHFVEVQRVDKVENRLLVHTWGVREGQLAFMIHSGSRNVGIASTQFLTPSEDLAGTRRDFYSTHQGI